MGFKPSFINLILFYNKIHTDIINEQPVVSAPLNHRTYTITEPVPVAERSRSNPLGNNRLPLSAKPGKKRQSRIRAVSLHI
jgi:hypothetical protein